MTAFEVLEPVGLGTDLHGVADHRQKVDEESGLDQCGQRRLPHPVVGGEALESGAFGVVVVVDVHVGERPTAVAQVVDQLAGGRAPPRRGRGPRWPGSPRCPLGTGDQAEEEEQAGIGPPEGVTLEVEEDVALVGRRA